MFQLQGVFSIETWGLSFIFESRLLLWENHFNGLLFFLSLSLSLSPETKIYERIGKQLCIITQVCAVGSLHLCETLPFRRDAHFLQQNVSLFKKKMGL